MGMVTSSRMAPGSVPGLKASTTLWGTSIEGMSSWFNCVRANIPATSARMARPMVSHLKRNDARVRRSMKDSIMLVVSFSFG